MLQNDFYSKENHGDFEVLDLGDFALDRGGKLPNAKLAYATHGKLNSSGDNAILFPVMFSGTSGSLKTLCCVWLSDGSRQVFRSDSKSTRQWLIQLAT